MTKQLAQETQFLHNVEMGLGAWSWGDRMLWKYGQGYTDQDIEAGFQAALAGGVNLVDTAEVYGSGRSETLLGQFLKRTDQSVLVATKFMPYPWRLDRGALRRSLQSSLDRLGLQKVDLYQIHWPFPPMPVEYWAEELARVSEVGLTRAVGVSNYNLSQMDRTCSILARHGIPLASNQVEYSLLDRRIEKNGLLERCQEMGVRLIAYSPLAKGLLTGKYGPGNPPPASRGRRYLRLLAEIEQLNGLLKEIGSGHGQKTPGQVALNWVICKGGLPIPGAKNVRQARENIGAIGWRLTPEEVGALDRASELVNN